MFLVCEIKQNGLQFISIGFFASAAKAGEMLGQAKGDRRKKLEDPHAFS